MGCLSLTIMQCSTYLFICMYIPKTYCSDQRVALITAYGLEELILRIMCNNQIQYILLKQLITPDNDAVLEAK